MTSRPEFGLNQAGVSKSVAHNTAAAQSFNRYAIGQAQDVLSAEQLESVPTVNDETDSCYIAPKYQLPSTQKQSEVTAATSAYNMFTVGGENSDDQKSAPLKISNQNALLSLMSHEDLDGIKNQIHQHINKIEEVSEDPRGEDEEATTQPTN